MTTKVTKGLATSFYVLGCLLLYKTRGRGSIFPKSICHLSIRCLVMIFTFVCFGIDTPELRGTSDEVKALAYKVKNRTQELLSDAKTIELKNPQRDKYFRVLAEVWIDGESLGEKLKSDGLAKDYYGEGARPEW